MGLRAHRYPSAAARCPGFTMVVRGSLVMLGRGLVVAATLVRLRAHVALLSLWSIDGGETATSI
jgi:hypothetical protein